MPIIGERESGSERDVDVEELKHSLQVATEENRSLKEELTAQQIENAESLEMFERREKHMAELEQALDDAKSSSRIEKLTSELEQEGEREREMHGVSKLNRLRC